MFVSHCSNNGFTIIIFRFMFMSNGCMVIVCLRMTMLIYSVVIQNALNVPSQARQTILLVIVFIPMFIVIII